MSEPLISVVIPVHVSDTEGLDLLDVQLSALADQDYAGAYEVVVADNRSPDIVREHLTRHPLRADLNLRWVPAPDKRGAAHARNVGARAAAGEILLFCDHDDRVHPEWMRRMVEFLDKGYDLISSGLEDRSLNPARRRLSAMPEPEKIQYPGAFAPVIMAGSMACRACVYRDLGGMDEDFFSSEDVAFGWRAFTEGHRTGYLSEALVAVRFRADRRAGYRQGRARGLGYARLHAEFPANGMPPVKATEILWLAWNLPHAWSHLPEEEWGVLAGLAVGYLHGGLRHRVLRWR